MFLQLRRTMLCAVLFACLGIHAAAPEPLPLVSTMFADNMVLQRGKPIRLWGWAKPGEHIRVELDDKSATATADASGRWETKIKAPAPGGPYEVKITGENQTVILHNVLVGDVWLCGGQSNMQLGLMASRNGPDEVKNANQPGIRFIAIPSHVSYAPTAVANATWKVVTPKTAVENGGISAVAYFFGRKLHDELHVPIGLIQDCVGGTPAESWTSPEALRPLKDFDEPLAQIRRLHEKGGPEYGSFLMHWLDDYDIGRSNWFLADFDDSDWKPVKVPGGFAELGVPETPGVAWFRKEFVLPDPLPTNRALLFLGSIEKMDTTYINGHWVGASSWVENPRVYFINRDYLKPGKNSIVIRVFKLKPDGGFLAKPEAMRLVMGDMTIPLAGEWKGKLSVDARPPHPLPLMFENYPTMPAVLFEGMIEPVAPYSIRGAIWYQGEANFERSWQYRKLLPAMIADWRNVFHQGDFPFYIVSLPAFMHRRDRPTDDAWAEMRDAQALTAKTVKHSGLAVTVDTGDADNIHPKDKQIVGERLALCALAKEYSEKIPCEGPIFTGLKHLPGALNLRFAHTDGGLVCKGEQLGEFSVAGADRQWHWAQARIDGDSVIVWSPKVPEPVAARYAWQANPLATLYNGAGLPAVPFRTDDWPAITERHKPW